MRMAFAQEQDPACRITQRPAAGRKEQIGFEKWLSEHMKTVG